MRFLPLILSLVLAPTLAGQRLAPADINALPSTPVTLTASYGSDALEVGDLRVPAGKGPFPVVVVVHGGCWTRGFATRQNTAALASALTAHGFATWNVEYRQVGDAGGGWPGTFQDWANATDYLRVLAKTQPLDLTRVSTVGHSAGAHAALWIAARGKLPAGSEVRGARPLPIHAAVAIDGPGELAKFIGRDAAVCGQPVIEPLLGGSPTAFPQRYSDATPADHFPLGVPQALVAANVLTPPDAADYAGKARAAGDSVDVLLVKDSGHFEVIAPDTVPGAEALSEILKVVR